jgi:hypothetical protein
MINDPQEYVIRMEEFFDVPSPTGIRRRFDVSLQMTQGDGVDLWVVSYHIAVSPEFDLAPTWRKPKRFCADSKFDCLLYGVSNLSADFSTYIWAQGWTDRDFESLACRRLVNIDWLRTLLEHDNQRFDFVLDVATRLGNSRVHCAQGMVASLYYHGFGVEQDTSIAREWYQKAADGQDGASADNLALMYFNGENGLTRDCDKGMYYKEVAQTFGVLP